MTIADLLSGAVLLPAIGALASVMSRSKSGEDKAPDQSDSTSTVSTLGRPTLDSEVDVLRALHQVQLIDAALEGTAVTRLPGGVYGFTYAPLHGAPIFRDKKAQSFEVHKLPDDRIHLVGFVKEEDARASASDEQLDLNVYPDAWEDAFTAISIPVSRIHRSRGPSRSDGNAVTLDLIGDSETVQ